ncbi:LOW QUALITY PROTEIN: transcription initiation factor TFIID subunit 1-like [Pollicipes pollicipes]|uniref:LOW QUALITY PROTEIN: transcription initiation factor TFIID subunit 1-like n=1 Tax=Pollicipes pollicipes TaxID=41117 RepID=UPI001884CF7C|nr:LOW QUALITY PROTEIN: transcription initiation factor TFIID subunit 1-like [Pollicipes pollicipes]
MSDSDSDSGGEGGGGLDLTAVLFGNIDSSGQLETDVLDAEARAQLRGLSKLGLGQLLHDVVGDAADDKRSGDEEEEPVPAPLPTAVDYWDITELAEEDTSWNTQENGSDDYDADDEQRDARLMPPPAALGGGTAAAPAPRRKQLNTPLGAMLPEKYANVEITEIFPDFREDKVLRFSRLFGPGRQTSLPQPWRNIRRKRRKRRRDEEEPDARPRELTLCFGPPLPPELVESDDEEKLLRPEEVTAQTRPVAEDKPSGNSSPKATDWRFGPSQLWYDMLDWPSSGESYNYGFREGDEPRADAKPEVKKEATTERDEDAEDPAGPVKFEDDAYLMVTQLNWEDDVIWNGEDIKHKVMQKLTSKTNAAGWLPSGYNRTAGQLSHAGKPTVTPGFPAPAGLKIRASAAADGKSSWFSIFPVENEELVYGRWEDDIIYDPEDMGRMPRPRILTLDPNDENVILGIPEDVDPTVGKGEPGEQRKIKIPHPHVRKSKILLGKAGVITHLDEETPPATPEPTDKDPFNISNDEYYLPKTTDNSIKIGSATGLLQHSIPVVELQAPFVPTHMGPIKLRQFHRPPLKKFSNGPLASNQPVPVQPLQKNIKRKAKQREQERLMSGGGDVFFMRSAEDLTGRDGDMVLVEHCEEHPAILSQVGMCTKIKNYYKRKAGKDPGPPEMRYGETALAHTSPFLGVMQPGKCVQTVENNMYRAPIYPHRPPDTDFIVIRTRQGYFIREADALFTAGQQCPLYEVPGPNSKRANNFTRDFLQVFIYRLFWKSHDNPRRIKMEVIKRAFPHHSESSIRKRLKPCADFKRTGMDSNWWVIKPEFRLPTEEEIRAMVSPEQCCGHFSMIAAEQRLRDAGYGEKFLLTQGDDEDSDMKIDDEIKVAPWNTTRAYIQAAKGKCLLLLTGTGDPTGCGEGFSYIRVPNKPTQNKEEQESQPKRIVTGTDADLRRLSLANAKALLKNFGVPDEEIKKLSRWEVIDVVRTLSTEKAKAGEEGMDRFSRGNRFSIAEHQERYKEECQRLYELQNRVLASDEVLSTDEGSSSEEENDDDIEEHGRNIENMLSNKKTSTQLSLEKEERERRELHKIMMGDAGQDDTKDGLRDGKKDKRKKEDGEEDSAGRVLRIMRTFRNSEGGTYTRIETVRKQAVIDAYLRIRTTKDDSFIKQFAGQLDETQKEEMKREKRRIQEQLRRIKRNQEKERLGLSQQPRQRKPKLKPDLKLKCGACGQVGHMRTNKACPQYQGPGGPQPPMNVAMTEQEEEDACRLDVPDDEELINVDGTKIKLSGKVIKQAEELKRKSLLLKVPKDAMSGRRRRRMGLDLHCDYLHRRQKTANRRRIDPLITFSTILEGILNEMRDMPDVQPFLFPVNAKTVPDYYKIIQRPMDLQTIRENLRQKKYQSREEFLADVSQIVENSKLYNGAKSVLTLTAEKMRNHLIDWFAEKEDRLMKLEKAINPLLDDDDQVGLTYILERIVNEKVKTMQESWPFLRPVNRKLVKDYYAVIKQPVDIETIEKKVKSHKYHSSREFVADFELLLENCVTYNGKESSFSEKAQALVDAVKSTVEKYEDDLRSLEANIAAAQQRALENADNDSLGTGSINMDDESHLSEGTGRVTPTEDDDVGSEPRAKRSRTLEEDLEYSDEEDQMAGLEHGQDDMDASEVGGDEPMLLELPQEEEHDDSEDFDPSYDPSAFLYGLSSARESRSAPHAPEGAANSSRIHSDLQISDSEGEDDERGRVKREPADDDDDGGGLYF